MTEILALKSLGIVKKSFIIPEIPRIQCLTESNWEIIDLFQLKSRKRRKTLISFQGIQWDKVEYDMDDQGRLKYL